MELIPPEREAAAVADLDPARVMAEFVTEATYITDADGIITWASPTTLSVLGYPPAGLRGRRVRDLVADPDRVEALRWRETLMAQPPEAPAITTEPLRVQRADGSLMWCSITARLVFDSAGKAVGITGSLRDIDDVVNQREAAWQAHRRLHDALDAQLDPVVVLAAVHDESGEIADFRFEDANSAAAAFHARPPDKLIGYTLLEVLGPEEGPVDVEACARVLSTGSPVVLNDMWSTLTESLGGPPTWLDVRIVPVDGDRVLYTWSVVTDRYLARTRVAQAHDLLRAVIDTAIEPHAILHAVRDDVGSVIDFTFEDCNEAAAEFEGWTREELLGRGLRATAPTPQDAELDISECARVLATRTPNVQNDVVTGYRRDDGRPAVVDLRVVPIDEERVSYTWRDVTDRYDDQRRRAESEERFRLLAETSSDVVYLADLDGRITWVAPNITRTLGWYPGDWVGALPGDFFHPDDSIVGSMGERAEESRSTRTPEGLGDARRVRAKDGGYRWMSASHEALYDSAHNLIGVSGSLKDVDELVRAQFVIAQAHDTLRAVIDNQVDPLVIAEAVRNDEGRIIDFRYLDCNAAAARFEGLARDRMIGRTYAEVYFSATEAEEDIELCARALEGEAPVVLNDEPTTYLDDQGRYRVVDIRIVSIGADRVAYAYQDVTDRFEARARLTESEERFRLLAENMSDVVVLVTNGTVRWVSPSAERTLGWQPGELVGTSPVERMHPDDVEAVVASWQSVTEGPLPRIRFRLRDSDDRWRWMESDGNVVTSGNDRQVVLGARVVDAEVQAQLHLERMAQHDELTGLVNRHAVLDHLARTVSGDARSGTHVGVLFCDLDGFKDVNDRFGHSAGDVLLQQVAERLRRTVRSGDIVSRVGGDELLIVLNGVRDLDDALRVAEKVRSEIARPVEVPGGTARVTASIGVTLARPGESVDDLVANADEAMYAAKRGGKDAVVALRDG